MKRTANCHFEEHKRHGNLNRCLSLLLSLMMVFGMFSGLNISAGAVEAAADEIAAEAETTESVNEAEPIESDLPMPEPEAVERKPDLVDTGAHPDLAETGASYELWLGSTQVTDANKGDILGDGGKAQFDPSTHTLTLSDPTISGEHNYSKIFCNGFDLTVKGNYTMTSAQSDNALTVFDHDLTLDGNFTFFAWCYAVEASYDINVVSGRVIAKLEDGGSEQCQAFCSDAGSITFGDNVEYFEAAVTSTWNTVYAVAYSTEGTVTLSSKLKLTTPEGGSFREGSCYYYESGKQKRAKTVIIEPADPTDIKYEVWVGATQVTAVNKNDILGDGGNAKYDPSTATLTLNNPTISTNYSSGGKTHKIYAAEDITVKGSYTMTTYSADYGIYGYMNLTLDGNFTILSGIHGVYARYTLTINGSLVGKSNSTTYTSSAGIKASQIAFGTITRVEAEGKKVYGIYAERGLTIPPEYEITTPSASYIENGTVVDNSSSSSTVAKRVVITPVVGGLGVFLGEKQVTESNAADIFGDGKASYDKDTKTLTVNYPTIRGCYTNEYNKTCVFYSKDDLTITGSYNHIDYSYDYGIYCDENLTINADYFTIGGKNDTIYVKKDLTVNGYDDGVLIIKAHSSDPTYPYGISCVGTLTIGTGLTHLEAEGDSCAIYCKDLNNTDEDLCLTTPDGGIFRNKYIYESDNTTIAKRVVFSRAYKLWLGSTRVTEANKDDILGDGGKAKYNPKTQALTLNDPTIEGDTLTEFPDAFIMDCKISSEGIDLTIFGSYHMTEADVENGTDYGVGIKDGDLTLNGSFTFKGIQCGIKGYGNLKIIGGSVTSVGIWGRGITCFEDITISGGSVTSQGNVSGIYSDSGDVKITGGSVKATGKTKCGVNVNNGSLTVGSGAKSVEATGGGNGIYAEKDIIINGGSVTAEGNSGFGMYASAGDITIGPAVKNVNVTAMNHGIYAMSGAITINGGVISAKTTNDNPLNNIGCAIKSKTDLTIGGDVISVTAIGQSCGLGSSDSVVINGGDIIARSYGSGYGILGNDGVEIKGGTVYAEGTRNYNIEDDPFNYYGISSGAGDITFIGDIFVDANGANGACSAAGKVYTDYFLIIEALSPQHVIVYKEIKLWVGSTQVNTGNMNDICGDGKASFDLATKTLTLNDPTITGTTTFTDKNGKQATCLIRTSGISLTIKGSYEMALGQNVDYGIVAQSGALTLDGDFTIIGKATAVYTTGKLNVVSGKINAYTLDTTRTYYAAAASLIKFESGTRYFYASGGIRSEAGIEIKDPLVITTPSGAKVTDNTITESNGTTTARTVEIKNPTPLAVLGDVDFDGNIEIRDATWIQRHTASIDIPFTISKKTADVDGDGEITVMDATAIQYYLANMKNPYDIGKKVSQ